jgi:radical SAM protein with 4Fe4S-binding SPASM domain
LFSKYRHHLTIIVSLYGMCEKTYASIARRNGSFHTAWQGVHYLIEKNVPFTVMTVLLNFNADDVRRMAAWVDTLPGMKNPLNIESDILLRVRRDSPEYNRRIAQCRMSLEEHAGHACSSRSNKYIRQFLASYHTSDHALFDCGAGILKTCVDAYGYLSPCAALKSPDYMVDVKVVSLRKATHIQAEKCQRVNSNNPLYLTRCAKCFLQQLCEQCPAVSWRENGVIDEPVSYFCNTIHQYATNIGLLASDEKAWELSDASERIASFVSGNNLNICSADTDDERRSP